MFAHRQQQERGAWVALRAWTGASLFACMAVLFAGPTRAAESAAHAFTDRVIVIWKGEVAMNALEAAKAAALPAPVNGKHAPEAITLAKLRAEQIDPGRRARLDRIEQRSAEAGQPLRFHRQMGDGSEVLLLSTRVSPEHIGVSAP